MWFGSSSCGAEVWRAGDEALALVENSWFMCTSLGVLCALIRAPCML